MLKMFTSSTKEMKKEKQAQMFTVKRGNKTKWVGN